MRLSRDGVAGLIFLALSVGLWILSRGLPQSALVPIGPEFYPRIVLAIMGLLSVLLVASDLWPRPEEEPPANAAPAEAKRNYRLVAATFAVFAIYVALLPLIGYRVATFLFVAALQAVFALPRDTRRWAALLVSALATAALTYVVFDSYLSVLLPRGLWTGF